MLIGDSTCHIRDVLGEVLVNPARISEVGQFAYELSARDKDRRRTTTKMIKCVNLPIKPDKANSLQFRITNMSKSSGYSSSRRSLSRFNALFGGADRSNAERWRSVDTAAAGSGAAASAIGTSDDSARAAAVASLTMPAR
jgi:hypothetical protein